jgi:hypothetical protein
VDHCLALLELLSDIRLLDWGFRISDLGFMKGLKSDLIQEKTTMGMAEGARFKAESIRSKKLIA